MVAIISSVLEFTLWGAEVGTAHLTGLIAVVVLLFCSALISGSETAFFSLNPAQIRMLREAKKAKDAMVLALLLTPKRLLATILITNNFVNVAMVVILSFLLNSFVSLQLNPVLFFFLQVVLITSLILLFGEIMPKVLATRKALAFSRLMALPLKFLSALLYPASSFLISGTAFIDKRISRKPYNYSLDDLSQAIDLTTGSPASVEEASESNILKGIAKFGDTDASEIMRPRLDLTAVEKDTPFSGLLRVIYDSGFSRIPVYEETLDNIRGILYIKDLLPFIELNDYDWNKKIRPAYFVPESKKISDLLREFQKKKIHMAIVVDEYGGTSGIVTLEDVIEEIVGDINDEFDTEGGEFTHSMIDDKNWMFDAKTSLLDFCRITSFPELLLEEERGEAETLAGLILEKYGRIPSRNEEIRIGRLTFRIESSDNRRIKLIKVTIHE